MAPGIIGKNARAARTISVCAFLRKRFPVKTACCVEAETLIAADTFRKWDAGLAAPSFVHFLTLISVYGPEFLAAVYESAPDWLSAAVRDQQIHDLEDSIAKQKARLAELERA